MHTQGGAAGPTRRASSKATTFVFAVLILAVFAAANFWPGRESSNWMEATCFAWLRSPMCHWVGTGNDQQPAAIAPSAAMGVLTEQRRRELQDFYLFQLDQWVEAGADMKTLQERVVDACGKLVVASASPDELKAFLGGRERETFDFRTDVCAKLTVNRRHPQPEFKNPAIVKMVCSEMPPVFTELCRRAGLKLA